MNEREVGQRLVAILRKRHPDLAFEVGIQDGGRFRPLPSGMAEIHRLEPATDEPEAVAAPYPNDTEQAA